MAWPPAAYPLDEDITGATTIASRPHGAQHDEANTSINEIVAYLVGLPWDAGLAAHLADAVDAHDASAISVVPFGTIAATTVQAALEEIVAEASGGVTDHGALTGLGDNDHPQYALDADFDAHLADATDAHDASAISFSPASGIAATDVQAAIVEAVADWTAADAVVAAAASAALTAHTSDTTDAHDASAISVVPFGTIAATDVQAALEEIVAEASGGVTDHGALTGLGDNDHPQYVLDTGDAMTGDLLMNSSADILMYSGTATGQTHAINSNTTRGQIELFDTADADVYALLRAGRMEFYNDFGGFVISDRLDLYTPSGGSPANALRVRVKGAALGEIFMHSGVDDVTKRVYIQAPNDAAAVSSMELRNDTDDEIFYVDSDGILRLSNATDPYISIDTAALTTLLTGDAAQIFRVEKADTGAAFVVETSGASPRSYFMDGLTGGFTRMTGNLEVMFDSASHGRILLDGGFSNLTEADFQLLSSTGVEQIRALSDDTTGPVLRVRNIAGTAIFEVNESLILLDTRTRLYNVAADPGTLTDGEIWYRTDIDRFRGRANGTTFSFATTTDFTTDHSALSNLTVGDPHTQYELESNTPNVNARVAVNKNSGATVGTRRRINFIEGSNVTLTIADDAGNEEVDVTIAASGGGGSFDPQAGNFVVAVHVFG